MITDKAYDTRQGKRTPSSTGQHGGGYNRNGAKLILLEANKEHGQLAVDKLIRELGLEETFGFKPGESLFA